MQKEGKSALAWSREGPHDGALSPKRGGVAARLAFTIELPPARSGTGGQPPGEPGGNGSAPRLRFVEGFLQGRSPVMAALYGAMACIARGDVPVLLAGETGTGKELLARTIHLSSPRAAGPFVAVNCAAIPADLLEPEMFGIERGVATGVEKRVGSFEAARGGTLFLDEIGEMPPRLQAKLLRALQDAEVKPVGGRARRIDVRVLSATNAELERRIEEGLFRPDLYYRLAGAVFRIPPLRERPEDVAVLAEAFLRRYGAEAGKRRIGLTQRALDLLIAYSWPGNVRELQNELRRATYLAAEGAPIDAEGLMLGRRLARIDARPEPSLSLHGSLELAPRIAGVERLFIEEALRRTRGNRSRAARLLGICRNTLAEKMRRLGVEGA